jgi:hypothetical protein
MTPYDAADQANKERREEIENLRRTNTTLLKALKAARFSLDDWLACKDPLNDQLCRNRCWMTLAKVQLVIRKGESHE